MVWLKWLAWSVMLVLLALGGTILWASDARTAEVLIAMSVPVWSILGACLFWREILHLPAWVVGRFDSQVAAFPAIFGAGFWYSSAAILFLLDFFRDESPGWIYCIGLGLAWLVVYDVLVRIAVILIRRHRHRYG